MPASHPTGLSMIDQEKLEKFLKRLELKYANCQHARDRPELTEIDREAVAESVLQRFKTAYDALGLPFRVDLHVWDEVPERFYEIIRGEYLALS